MGLISSIAGMFRKIGVVLGLLVDKATENPAFDMATIEAGIREKKAKAESAVQQVGKLKAAMALLKIQIAKQTSRRDELQAMMSMAADKNDEVNGARYAEDLSILDGDLKDNNEQLEGLTSSYEDTLSAIAEASRQIQAFQRDFERTKAQHAASQQMVGVADLLRSTNDTMQGILGGEDGRAMERLKASAEQGKAAVEVTKDLAKKMGTDVMYKQVERQAHGQALFKQFQAARREKQGSVLTAPSAEPADDSSSKAQERRKVEA